MLRMLRKGASRTVGGSAVRYSHCKNQCEFPEKIAYDTVFPFLGIYTKESEADFKEYMLLCVHCSIIYNSQDLEAAQVPIRS